MKQEIKIVVLNDRRGEREGPAFFKVVLSNGETMTQLGVYAHSEDFQNLGESLSKFPKGPDEKVTFERGAIGKAYYFLLEAANHSNGQSAIKIIADNHTAEPFHCRAEFFINTDPASINKLGRGLMKWNFEEVIQFDWVADDYY
jgi:hypothetical protein